MGRDGPRDVPRPLAEAYRTFGEVDGTSPLSARIALAIAGSDAALRAIEAAPARRRQPALILAALHDLALAGRAPALLGPTELDPAAAVATLVEMTDAVVDLVSRRRTRTIGSASCAAVYPAVAEAAHRAGATAVGLIEVGGPAVLSLQVDRVGITYSDGTVLGDPSSPVRITAEIVGGRAVPARSIPEVVARVGVGPDPVDVTDTDETRWLHACIAPDHLERAARLAAELALATTAPPVLLRGSVVDLLPDAVGRVPAGALPVVVTTWALSRLPPAGRALCLQHLQAAAAGRPVAWVSAEGVGGAPSVPTLGDRPASGHSILGLRMLGPAVLGRPGPEALGRCWSRGRLLSWLADS